MQNVCELSDDEPGKALVEAAGASGSSGSKRKAEVPTSPNENSKKPNTKPKVSKRPASRKVEATGDEQTEVAPTKVSKRPALCKVEATGGEQTEVAPTAKTKAKAKAETRPEAKAKAKSGGAMKRPAAKEELKVYKSLYKRDGVWGVKVNGRETRAGLHLNRFGFARRWCLSLVFLRR